MCVERKMHHGILPTWEQWIYWIIGVSSIAYSWWRMYVEGDALRSQYLHHGLQRKWTFLQRYCDVSDPEWSLWRAKLGLHLGLCLAHVALSQACRLLKSTIKVRLCILVLCDLVFHCWILGPLVVAYMLLKTGLVWLASRMGGIYGVWMLLGLQLLANNVDAFRNEQDSFLGLSDRKSSYIFLVANGFLDIKLLSFGVDNAKISKDFHAANEKLEVDEISLSEESSSRNICKTSPTETLYCLEVLLYLFYFPPFIFGPIYLFHEFRHQIKSSFTSSHSSSLWLSEFTDILKNLLRICFWILFMDVSLHFLYFGALAYNSALKQLSLWALVSVGHSTGQFFMVKYLVIYGLAGQLGRFDGVAAPPEPCCISWVYSYTDMWKYFDTGLYKFIKVYVYIPLGGSRYGLVRQLAASGLVFLFIYVWHGGTYFLFIWCCGNYLVGSIEGIAGALEKGPTGQRLLSVIGPKMMLRMKCLLFAPAYLASCLQTFFFLFHVQEAWEITEGVLFKTNWTQFGMLMGIFYACIHNAMFIRSRICKQYERDIHKA